MITVQRHEAGDQPLFSLLDLMVVERGTKADWDRLHHLHYKAENLPPAPHFYRVRRVDTNELVAVCVTSSVSLLLGPRHDMLPKLRPHPGEDTTLTNKHRPRWLNDNMRRIGRIVTSTMYRGTGVAYRAMNLIARMERVRYVEIVSSMAKYNPFDRKAGFKRAPLKRAAAYEPGVKFLRSVFDCHPADQQAMLEEFEAQPVAIQKMLRTKLTQFYYRWSSKEKTGSNLGKGVDDLADMPIKELIRETQQLVFGYMIYSLYECPDHGDPLPSRLPLLAFDNQPTHHKLNKEALHA